MAVITLHGKEYKTIGSLPAVGSKAPDFCVTKMDLGEVRLSDYRKYTVVLNIFPSLDTATCALAMQRFNEMASKDPNLLVLCVSADLPFAQQRFCGVNGLNNVLPVSVFRHPSFGKDYGVLITDGPLEGLLARATMVIDKEGKVKYDQLVSEISEEPDYAALTTAIK